MTLVARSDAWTSVTSFSYKSLSWLRRLGAGNANFGSRSTDVDKAVTRRKAGYTEPNACALPFDC